MTLALHPTNALAFIWRTRPGLMAGAHKPPTPRRTCSVCRYELIDGWCSRCSLEEVFDAQNPVA